MILNGTPSPMLLPLIATNELVEVALTLLVDDVALVLPRNEVVLGVAAEAPAVPCDVALAMLADVMELDCSPANVELDASLADFSLF